MKVMVFGGAGFIGRRVVAAYARQGHAVVSVHVLTDEAFRKAGLDVIQIRLDISSFEDVVQAMLLHRPEIVINLSYLRSTDPHPAMRVNIQGMDNVFEAARLTGAGQVVFSSSIAVNGRQSHYGDRPITEEDEVYPTYQYAVHKVFNEWQAREYREKHGMTVTAIRVGHAAAPGKLLGAVDHVRCITGPALGEAVSFKYRDTSRCVIHVDDVADIIVRVSQKPEPEHSVYYTGGQTLSLGEIAEIVRAQIADADIRFENETGGGAFTIAYRFDNARLRSEFGLELPSYQQRVAKMIDDARSGLVAGDTVN